MTDTASFPSAHEVVGLFGDREGFENAVNALIEAGFERSDLSVLSSHEAIEAAGTPGRPWKDVLTAMVGEIKYEVPLVASGAILLVGGPVSTVLAGVIGTATAGMAVREVVEEVSAKPHTDDFARSLEAGSVILWVRAETGDKQDRATQVLEANGGANVHLHQGPSA